MDITYGKTSRLTVEIIADGDMLLVRKNAPYLTGFSTG
jgi:hypothetical protein